jgi:hypothetical protein
MNEAQAHEFYKDPDHLAVAGPGQRREKPMKTALIPVRFAPDVIAAVKRFAGQDGVTVSTWIRRLVSKELQRRQPSYTDAANNAPDVQFEYPEPIRPRSATISFASSSQLASIP